MTTNLSPNEQALLAREVAADGYRPSSVADEEDIRRVPRDAFVAGWDAAMVTLPQAIATTMAMKRETPRLLLFFTVQRTGIHS
jgi:hypothetical protein